MGDMIHPTAGAGVRAIADALIWLLAAAQDADETCDEPLLRSPPISLPPPLLGEATSDLRRCAEPGEMNVTLADGWTFVVSEEVNNATVMKPGWLASTPGAVLEFSVSAPNEQVMLTLRYLISYQRMGTALLTCKAGCSCAPVTLQGHAVGGVSIEAASTIRLTGASVCTLRLVVQNATLSGEHKFKVLGVMVLA